MAESLWNGVDDYLKAQILANLGPAGDYTTLKISDVRKWARFDVVDCAKLTLPAVIVVSPNSNAVPAGHSGAVTINRKNTYLITLVSVVEGTMEQATEDAKTLVWRVEDLFATLRFSGVAAADGSKADRVIGGGESNMFRSQVTLWDKDSMAADSVYGIGITAMAVTGTTA